MKGFNRSNAARVARWEFTKNVKNPMFLVMTFVVPLIMVVVGGIGFFAERVAGEQQLHVAVVDETGYLYSQMERVPPPANLTMTLYTGTREELDAEILEGTYDGYVILNQHGVDTGRIPYHVRDARMANIRSLRGYLEWPLTAARLEQMGLDPVQVRQATMPLAIDVHAIEEEDEAPISPASMIAPLLAGVVLVMSVMLSGQVLMYGVIKEKRNRIVEILLSSISSLELLIGKIMGFGALSLLQISVWVVAGLAVASRFLDIPDLGLTAGDIVPSLVFFLLGFLLLATLFAASGATMKDAEGGSQAQGLVILIPMFPMFIASVIMFQPNALWVRILSHLPPFSPVTMLLRLGFADIAPWEMGTTILALLLSSALFIWLGARVFEGAILQYDRATSLRDLRAILGRRGGRTRTAG